MNNMSKSTYFDWLESSASPAVKEELRRMEKSKQSSWSSVQDVIKGKYGQLKTSYPQGSKKTTQFPV